MKTQDSPAIQLLTLLWENRQKETSHSWLKLNHSMSDGLRLAIRMGLTFNLGDIELCHKRFRAGYWFGADIEWIYQLAVLYRNASAWKCFEDYRKRKPFIVKGAKLDTHTGDGPCGSGLARLVVGAEFTWNGEKVKITSFNDVNGSFVAVSYRRDGEWQWCSKCKGEIKSPKEVVARRYTITHADLAAERKERLRKAKPGVELP